MGSYTWDGATMLSWIFRKLKQETSPLEKTLDKLTETLEMLEKKEILLVKKALAEVGKAMKFFSDVDKTMDEINEQTENMKQISDALSQLIGPPLADFDEDELEAELEELEGAELEEQLLQPTWTLP